MTSRHSAQKSEPVPVVVNQTKEIQYKRRIQTYSQVETTFSALLNTERLEENATNFFFNEYVVEKEHAVPNIFHRLPGMYKSSKPSSPLFNILTALGLCCLSNTIQRPQIMLRANTKYAEALKSINASLRDPVLAKDDQTLLVVMLLGLYEEVSFTQHIIRLRHKSDMI